ncbi:MAG TPA: hypothetical protein VGM38_02495 [Pseudolysinimonas sp.]|jgi:hypothetical protein
MPRQFVLECLVDLPPDAFDQAEIIAKIKAPWATLVEALNDSSVNFQQKSEIMEVRAKPATGAKRGRKPKAQPAPALAFAPPPEAAE